MSMFFCKCRLMNLSSKRKKRCSSYLILIKKNKWKKKPKAVEDLSSLGFLSSYCCNVLFLSIQLDMLFLGLVTVTYFQKQT